jgi:hypothetical protein
MRDIKIETVNAPIERSTQLAIICDVCKRRSPAPDSWYPDGQEFIDIAVYRETGNNNAWKGPGHAECASFDICPECWGKLVEWLKSQGAEPTVTKSSW